MQGAKFQVWNETANYKDMFNSIITCNVLSIVTDFKWWGLGLKWVALIYAYSGFCQEATKLYVLQYCFFF